MSLFGCSTQYGQTFCLQPDWTSMDRSDEEISLHNLEYPRKEMKEKLQRKWLLYQQRLAKDVSFYFCNAEAPFDDIMKFEEFFALELK